VILVKRFGKILARIGRLCLRATAQPEALHKQPYQALGLKSGPIGKNKTIIARKKSIVPTDSS
jgi:hypothetical protein